MTRVPALLLSAALIITAGACAPVTSYNGFQARDEKPADVKTGVDTRSTVLAKLGSPSAKSSFGDPVFYYISQTVQREAFLKPRVTDRNVVAISFDKDEKVTTVNNYKLKDGFRIAYDDRSTPTRGREVNWLEQILGTIGRGGMLPQDNDPGQARGAGR